LFLLTKESSFALIDLLSGKSIGTTLELDEFGCSILQELGNILCGSFLTALSEVTKLTFTPSVPAFAFDMLGAVLSAAFVEGGYFEDQALIIETQFYQKDIKINGHFFLVPEPECLNVIFRSLGLDLDGGM
jgi:chemotaxis protein CheC